MRILMSGSSGLIGTAAAAFLGHLGHQVIPLVRHPLMASVFWDPKNGRCDSQDFEGFDAAIHLAGKNIACFPWTESCKREIDASRFRDTRFLCQMIGRLQRPPKTLIVASAVGFYGHRGDALLTESAPPGRGFLAKVCNNWEGATASIDPEKVRVMHTRFGIVLSPKGGALRKLLWSFRLGLGAILGKGDQYLSWVTLEDVCRVLPFLLQCERLSGPVNVVSPFPETNQMFSRKLARALKRPCVFHVPTWLLRGLMGAMADELLLASTRAIPEKLMSAGFSFAYKRVDDYFATL